MKTITAILLNGALSPAQQLPAGVLLVVCNGAHYVCYEDGDELPAAPDPTIESIAAELEQVVQSHLDATAGTLGYDSIATAVTYAEEVAVPKFQAEGRALRAWRSLVWARCYQLLAEVQGGSRGVPSSEDLISLLPTFSISP